MAGRTGAFPFLLSFTLGSDFVFALAFGFTEPAPFFRALFFGAFFLGAEMGSGIDQGEAFAAHAWLKCGQEFITGEAGHEHYKVVSCISWS